MDNKIEKNKRLQREIYDLLGNESIPKEERVILQNHFISSFYEILKISFDVSLDPKKLNYYFKNNNIKSKFTNALFIAKTIDNPKAYDYINYFCYNYIRIIKKIYF